MRRARTPGTRAVILPRACGSVQARAGPAPPARGCRSGAGARRLAAARMPRPLASAVLWPLSLLVGVGAFALTNLVEPALPATLNFGTDYAAMAADPFGYVGSFPHRLLTPLCARGLDELARAFGGSLPYWQFAHGCTIAFLAILFGAAHRLGATPAQALLLTLGIGFTGAVQLYKGHVGYPEPVTFALLLASLLAARRSAWFWSLQLLNLLHHEQILFFWPWLCWWRRRHGARWRDDLVGGSVTLAIYVGWRMHVGTHAKAQMLTLSHYLGLDYFPVGTLGLAALNLLAVFMWFGAMPLLLAWHVRRERFRDAGAPLLLFLLCQHAMFGVAHDVYRFTCFLFLPLLLAGLRLMQERRGPIVWTAFAVASAALVVWQRPVFVEVGVRVLTDTGPDGVPFVRPHIVADIVPKVIPAMPWTFAAYGAAALVTIAAALARANRPT